MSTTTRLREYQIRAFKLARDQSLIVVLPTGSGKTLIAAAVALEHLNEREGKVLFLVPTCLLVSQQAAAIRYETNKNVTEYMGGASTPKIFDILVSTPAAFIKLSEKSGFEFQVFGLFIFDEVHHVVKRHPYRTIARRLSGIQASYHIRILGLTASLTYAIGESEISQSVEKLCLELNMSGSCIFTASPENLAADGYHGSNHDRAEKNFGLKTDSIEFSEGTSDSLAFLEIPGKVHENLSSFLSLVKQRLKPIHDLSLCIMDTISLIESEVKLLYPSFVSPIGSKGKRGKVGAWGEYANDQKRRVRNSSCEFSLFNLLEHFYESVRLIINSRQCGLELAIWYLIMNGILTVPSQGKTQESPLSHTLRKKLNENQLAFLSKIRELQFLWETQSSEFVRMPHLKQVLLQQVKRFQSSLRLIVFTQQRVTTHILKYFVDNDEDLYVLSTDVIYSTASPATSELRVTPSQAKERIQKFSSGDVSILFATSVAEEGMDIPAANCVIRFDPIQTPVSLVQSKGRARQQDRAFVVMAEDKTRTVSVLEDATHQQLGIIADINAKGVATCNETAAKFRLAQVSRQRGAYAIIEKFFRDPSIGNALMSLNSYAQKVSGEVLRNFSKSKDPPNYWQACLSLDQFNTEPVKGSGSGISKQVAIQNAAFDLLDKLR